MAAKDKQQLLLLLFQLQSLCFCF